jgi:2-keto-4-pentenoate hydratase/2-oxohepta-3-ene-1,7-dioic acid hydratase in catechol pathway
MKLLTFDHDGAVRYGAAVGDEVVDLTARIGGQYQSVLSLLQGGNMREAASALTLPGPRYDLAKIQYRAPLEPAHRIFCVGANYPKRNPLGGVYAGDKHPLIFAKVPDALVPHRAKLTKPSVSNRYDYEGELAVVIGRAGWNIPHANALSHVAGYTCLNDGSARDFQAHSVWAGKNFFRSGSWGPWIVTADEIPDPGKLNLETRINGEITQSGNTGTMFFSVQDVISYVSQIMPLQPGDVIATGSPERLGDTQRALSAGDRIEITIQGIGTLTNSVA